MQKIKPTQVILEREQMAKYIGAAYTDMVNDIKEKFPEVEDQDLIHFEAIFYPKGTFSNGKESEQD